MNWQVKLVIYKTLIGAGLFFVVGGCGVKGDPIPPEKPPSLGRGRPTYKRATEEIMTDKKKQTSGKADSKDENTDGN